MDRLKFRSSYLGQIVATDAFRSRAKFIEIGQPYYVELPTLTYGGSVSDIPKIDYSRQVDEWDIDRYLAMPPCVYVIKNSVIHTAYGLLTIDDHIAFESTAHFPDYFFQNCVEIYDNGEDGLFWSIEDFSTRCNISVGISCHYGINENYYHWLILFLPKLCSELVEVGINQVGGVSPTIIFPPLDQLFQIESAKTIAQSLNLSYIIPEKSSKIFVNELIYTVPERGIGLTPHPIIRNTLSRLRGELYDPEFPGAERIFISRRDTGNRKIANEFELERTLSDIGFLVVTLSELSLQQQISLFAKAKIIIGQHGAGLTNICFCDPGAKLLELHNPSYQNWCYRRLSALFAVQYGFLFGEELNAEPTVHVSNLIMSVNVEKVLSAVSTMIK